MAAVERSGVEYELASLDYRELAQVCLLQLFGRYVLSSER